MVGFGIPGESGLADAINFAGMIFALDCNCRDLQFSELHQEPVLKSVQTPDRTLLVRHHFSFPVMAAVVAPPSTPLQLLGEFALEMLQAWVVSHAPSDPGGVPKRGFKNTYTTVLKSLVSRYVDAAFQAFGPMISWMMVARSNGVAGLCDAASAGIDRTANIEKTKAAVARPNRVGRSNSQSSALHVTSNASGLFSRFKPSQDPLLKQINGPAFGRSCCVRTSSTAAPPSASTQQYFTCCAVRASAALGVCTEDGSFDVRGDTLSSVAFTLHSSSESPPVCVRAWRWGSLFLCLCHPLVEGACVMLPPGELSRRLCDLDSLLSVAEQSGVEFQP